MRMNALGVECGCCCPRLLGEAPQEVPNTESGHRFASVITKHWAGIYLGWDTQQGAECVRRLGPQAGRGVPCVPSRGDERKWADLAADRSAGYRVVPARERRC